MRKDEESGIEEPALDPEPRPAPEPKEVITPEPNLGADPREVEGSLSHRMMLSEPQRTDALERAVASAEAIMLRSTTGGIFRKDCGGHMLEVPPGPKPFTAGHAIDLLFYAGPEGVCGNKGGHQGQIEEVLS